MAYALLALARDNRGAPGGSALIQATRLSLVLAGAAVLLALPLAAQEAPVDRPVAQEAPFDRQAAPAPAEVTQGATLEQVGADLAAIEADDAIEKAVKDGLRPVYKQAVAALTKAADLEARAAAYREAIETSPEKAAALRAEIEALPPAESAPPSKR